MTDQHVSKIQSAAHRPTPPPASRPTAPGPAQPVTEPEKTGGAKTTGDSGQKASGDGKVLDRTQLSDELHEELQDEKQTKDAKDAKTEEEKQLEEAQAREKRIQELEKQIEAKKQQIQEDLKQGDMEAYKQHLGELQGMEKEVEGLQAQAAPPPAQTSAPPAAAQPAAAAPAAAAPVSGGYAPSYGGSPVGSGGFAPAAGPAPVGKIIPNGSGDDAVNLGRQYLGQASINLKGKLPNFTAAGGNTNNCADFVSALLESTGRLKGHYVNVEGLESALQKQGYVQIPASQAKPGDVWMGSDRGHTELVSGAGGTSLIGSNNVRPGYQVISEKSHDPNNGVYYGLRTG